MADVMMLDLTMRSQTTPLNILVEGSMRIRLHLGMSSLKNFDSLNIDHTCPSRYTDRKMLDQLRRIDSLGTFYY